MRTTVLLVTPLAVLVGLNRPAALAALLMVAVFVAGITRVGWWLLGDVADAPDVHAARAGLVAFATGVVFATSALLVGPLTVWLVVPATALVLLWFRPGRRSSVLPMPFVERRADER